MLVTTREPPSAEHLAGDMVLHHRDGDTVPEGLGRHRQTSITTPVPDQEDSSLDIHPYRGVGKDELAELVVGVGLKAGLATVGPSGAG